jgi:hypothetical protein
LSYTHESDPQKGRNQVFLYGKPEMAFRANEKEVILKGRNHFLILPVPKSRPEAGKKVGRLEHKARDHWWVVDKD